MSKTIVNGVNVHYQTKGEGANVILVHGLTASIAFWYNTKVFPTLINQFRVTAYDLKGHGYSDPTPSGYTSRDLAGELVALMDALGIERARVIGHSYGGSVTLHFALLYPERCDGIVLCDTGFAALRHLRNIDHWPGWEMWKNELPEFGITPDWFSRADQQGIETILRKSMEIPVQFGIRRGGSRDTPRFRKLLEETTLASDFRDPSGLCEERLAEITPPTMAVYGEISPFRNVATHLSETLPNCVGEIVPGVGHFFLLHAPDAFLERVTPYLHDPQGYVRSRKGIAAASTGSSVGKNSEESEDSLCSNRRGGGDSERWLNERIP